MPPDYPNPLSVVPNLINELQARSQMEVLLDESIDEKMYRRTEFASDTAEMTETELFESHYKILQTLYPDSLIIIDNF